MSRLAADIAVWLWEEMRDANADGYVVGLSGGIDSAVAAKLAVMGVGKENVMGVFMPVEQASEPVDSVVVADWLDVQFFAAPIKQPYEEMLLAFGEGCSKLPKGNLVARLRMCGLYYLANAMNYLVLGTGNRSELELGYFTKYGDGGVDVLPLGSLLKHEVRALARELEVPQTIIDKPPSAGLWNGQTDEDEIGVSYQTIDGILTTEYRWMGKTKDIVRVEQMQRASRHKRRMPPIYRRG